MKHFVKVETITKYYCTATYDEAKTCPGYVYDDYDICANHHIHSARFTIYPDRSKYECFIGEKLLGEKE